jgi:hypothetical protein
VGTASHGDHHWAWEAPFQTPRKPVKAAFSA